MLTRYPHSDSAEHAHKRLKSGQFLWWGPETVENGVITRRHRVVTILKNQSDGHGMGNALTKLRKAKRAFSDTKFRDDARGRQGQKSSVVSNAKKALKRERLRAQKK